MREAVGRIPEQGIQELTFTTVSKLTEDISEIKV